MFDPCLEAKGVWKGLGFWEGENWSQNGIEFCQDPRATKHEGEQTVTCHLIWTKPELAFFVMGWLGCWRYVFLMDDYSLGLLV